MKIKNYWILETCKLEAKKYKTRLEYSKNAKGSYEKARKENWLDDVCEHMIKPKELWTKELCIKKIELCSTKEDFYKKYNTAYQYCIRNKILDDVCKSLKQNYKPSGYWKFDECLNIAKQCKTKKEFRYYTTPYSKSVKNGWIEKIYEECSFSEDYKKEWIIYSYIFSNKYIYVGLTINEKSRKSNHLSNSPKSSVYKFIKENNIKEEDIKYTIEISGITDEKMIKKLEEEILKTYLEKGYKKINIKKTGNLGGGKFIWTKEKCFYVARKCSTKKEFRELYQCAYDNSRKNKWLNEIYDLFITEENKYDNIESCREESKKYKNKTSFKLNNHKSYKTAYDNKWIDLFFPKIDFLEKAIKNFNNTNSNKEFRDLYPNDYNYFSRYKLLKKYKKNK